MNGNSRIKGFILTEVVFSHRYSLLSRYLEGKTMQRVFCFRCVGIVLNKR